MNNSWFTQVIDGQLPSHQQAQDLASFDDTQQLADLAGKVRDKYHHNVMSYSRKVFIPLTQLCRDVCHYCTFAQTPKKIDAPYLSVEQVLDIAREGAKSGCKEALFTLGDKPELRYKAARNALAEMGFDTTLQYLEFVAKKVFEETGLIPHLNPGLMDDDEIQSLRKVSASMGIMLENVSSRLCEKNQPHWGSPDKDPEARLATLRRAGKYKIPFTSGILIGIGETRLERIDSLLALRDVQQEYGHIQEIIVQNFRAKPNTKMAQAPEPDLEDLIWTIAVARLIFGGEMSVQAPPNLSPGVLPQLVNAGINDWGGVSPITPDFVNPEAPWPHLQELAEHTASNGKVLTERLTVYPGYIQDITNWIDPALVGPVLKLADAEGFGKQDSWSPGEAVEPPEFDMRLIDKASTQTSTAAVTEILQQALAESPTPLNQTQVERLFKARGDDFGAICRAADELRKRVNGDTVSYVVNRNINYTNVCYFRCQFCAFSKGKLSENLRGKPYDLSDDEIARRVNEAWSRGATEVCMQGGIHPDYDGETYLNIVKVVKKARPDMHVHAFSPLEIWQGAHSLGLSLPVFLQQLKDAGLGTLPGTAAEILDDEVRDELCPDKINTQQWFEVMEAAHQVGFNTTATIMYGHIEKPVHWAKHLIRIREQQMRTGGFTEFVPLPFVHMEAPLSLKGKARSGPSFREAVLMHAVARLTLHPHIKNIQTSWVKMGHHGVVTALKSGVNDLGGTLMNESITRAAGSDHGQETSPELMESIINASGRPFYQRNTVYGDAPQERQQASYGASSLGELNNESRPRARKKRSSAQLYRPGLEAKAVDLIASN